jgi:hypothetical protein
MEKLVFVYVAAVAAITAALVVVPGQAAPLPKKPQTVQAIAQTPAPRVEQVATVPGEPRKVVRVVYPSPFAAN